MSTKRLARACAHVVVLMLVTIPVTCAAGLASSVAQFKAAVEGSFAKAAYYPSPPNKDKDVKAIVGPTIQSAVNAPVIQMNSVRQHLDQLRMIQSASTDDKLRTTINGQVMPTSKAVSSAANHTGGGASADKPDSFERWGVFINGDFDDGRQSTVGTQTGFKVRSDGVTVGTDYRFVNNSVVGAAVGFLKAHSDLDDGAGNQHTKGYGFSFYGSFEPIPNAYIDAIVNIGHNSYDGQRQRGNASFSNDTSGNQWGFALGAGYAFNQGALALTPYGRVEYVDAKVNGFTENGDKNLAYTIGEQRVNATTLALGGQASYAVSTSWGVLLPYGRLEYQYLAHSSGKDVTAQLVTDISSTSVPIQIIGQDKSFGTFAVGLSAVFRRGVSAFFNYQQLFAKDNVRDQLYTVGARLAF